MIPTFPDAAPLEPDLRAEIEAITARFEPYSDLQFGSLWAWDVDGSTRVSRLRGNLVVLLKDYQDDRRFYTLIGEQEIERTALDLIRRACIDGLEARIHLIPESVATAITRFDNLHIERDEANDDYLISNHEWAILDGPNYAAHRTKVSRWRRDAEIEERRLDLCDPADRREILRLFDAWATAKNATGPDRDLERRALIRLFAPVAAERIDGLGLYEHGRLIAFTLWEGITHAGCSLHHFMKTEPLRPGLSSYVLHRRAVHLARAGLPIANIEQDLGQPGLREFKRSLRPIGFLRKHTICARHGARS